MQMKRPSEFTTTSCTKSQTAFKVYTKNVIKKHVKMVAVLATR